MTTGTLTLSDFLLARIADDEAAQSEASNTPGHGYKSWHARACAAVEAEFYAACDCGVPARVLAECEAKRQIVEMHAAADVPAPSGGRSLRCPSCVSLTHDPGFISAAFPCPTLCALAVPYADHPDYREEWRP